MGAVPVQDAKWCRVGNRDTSPTSARIRPAPAGPMPGRSIRCDPRARTAALISAVSSLTRTFRRWASVSSSASIRRRTLPAPSRGRIPGRPVRHSSLDQLAGRPGARDTPHMSQSSPPDGGAGARHWLPAMVGLVTFGVTAAVTYSEELLMPLGNALAAGSAAVITGTFVYLLFPSAARVAATLVMLVAVGCLGFAWWQFRDGAPRGIASFVGGCEPFTVHAQNRYSPVGAAIRAAPMPTASKVGSVGPNELVAVDGWVRTAPAYPTNSPPFDSDVWFHLADDSGWVSFAGVRSDPTAFDATGLAEDGGRPAPVAEECSGTYRM